MLQGRTGGRTQGREPPSHSSSSSSSSLRLWPHLTHSSRLERLSSFKEEAREGLLASPLWQNEAKVPMLPYKCGSSSRHLDMRQSHYSDGAQKSKLNIHHRAEQLCTVWLRPVIDQPVHEMIRKLSGEGRVILIPTQRAFRLCTADEELARRNSLMDLQFTASWIIGPQQT